MNTFPCRSMSKSKTVPGHVLIMIYTLVLLFQSISYVVVSGFSYANIHSRSTSFVPTRLSSDSVQSISFQNPSSPMYTKVWTTLKASSSSQQEDESSSTAAEDTNPSSTQQAPPKSSTTGDGVADILNSPVFLKRKIDVLKSDLIDLEDKISAANTKYVTNKAEWGQQLDDLQREYLTIQDRFSKQRKEASVQATIEVAKKILDTMSNFDRAFEFVKATTEEEKSIEAAYKDAYHLILQAFQKLGIQEVETVGKEFNFQVHQAVMMRPSDEYEEGIIMEELAKGYIMDDGTLIRPAMVVVAA